eukprot:g46591.t1
MENSPPAVKRELRTAQRCAGLSGLACCLLAVLSLGLCALLHQRTSDLQSRVSHLEAEREQLPAWLAAHQLQPAIFNRVEELLDQ